MGLKTSRRLSLSEGRNGVMNAKKISLGIVIAIFLTSLWSASGTFDTPDAMVRANIAHQIVIQGRLMVTSRGDRINQATFQTKDGEITSQYGLGQSMFFLPFDAVASLITNNVRLQPEKADKVHNFLVSMPVFAVVLILNFWACLQLGIELGNDRFMSYLLAFVATFGSSFWQMAKQAQEEVQLSILLLSALYGFLCWRQEGTSKFAWLSAGAGAATVIFRLPSFPILLGITTIYFYEIYQHIRRNKSGLSKSFRSYSPLNKLNISKTILPFVILYLGASTVIVGYNFFKTGDLLKTGYATSEWFNRDWITGTIQPILGLDRGIVWTNLWLLPCLLVTCLAWHHLKYELKILLILSLFLFSSSIATYATCCWAGGWTYGARYQVHLVPLLCVTLGSATVNYIQTSFPRATTQVQRTSLLVGVLLVLLQIPSIAFVHSLELYQVDLADIPAKDDSQTGTIGQVKLRCQNFISKVMTGKPMQFEVIDLEDYTLEDLEKASRWNFWPWRVQQYLNSTLVTLLKMGWLVLVLGSLICWVYVGWLLFNPHSHQ